MPTRRRFVTIALGTTALSLSGCGISGVIRPGPPVRLPGIGIDAHMHLFNGADVPVMGWLTQVDFTSEGGGSVPELTKSPLVRMLVSFMVSLTPTAGDELARLPAGLPRPSPQQMEEEGKARLAGFLAAYQAQTQPDPAPEALRTAAPPDPQLAEDRALFEALADAAGVSLDDPAPAPGLRSRAARDPEAERLAKARELAEGLFDPARQAGDPGAESLAGMVRWAEMMTRDRARILQLAASLYGREGEARVFCGHLLDIGMWLRPAERKQSDPDELIDLFAELSRRRRDLLLLNFVGFCPLRAALEGEAVHHRVRRAIMERGYAGVKLYPPMGFRPIGNGDISFAHAKRAPAGGGAAIDRELHRLYAWCDANDVPIAAHASASMGAGPGTAAYSAPWHWAPVLRQYADLRVSLAHFGGFGGHGNPQWEAELIGMLGSFRNLYFDTGFWTETMRGAPQRPGSLALTRQLFAAEPRAAERMLYGSDWSMIARLPSHPRFMRDFLDFAQDLTGSETGTRAIMGDNALRWLGLDRPGAQSARLGAAHGGHPVWRLIAPA